MVLLFEFSPTRVDKMLAVLWQNVALGKMDGFARTEYCRSAARFSQPWLNLCDRNSFYTSSSSSSRSYTNDEFCGRLVAGRRPDVFEWQMVLQMMSVADVW